MVLRVGKICCALGILKQTGKVSHEMSIGINKRIDDGLGL